MTLSIAIGIPTVDRAAILREGLAALSLQTRRPDRVLVCGAKPSDVAGSAEFDGVEVLLSRPGLPAQRNTLLSAAPHADIMIFFDDDFLPDADYLAAIERHMTDDPTIVVATGRVLKDGIGGPGLSLAEAQAALGASGPTRSGVMPTFSGYGCNMAVRLTTMRRHGVLFDERLPLYGWQEDVDLSRRLAAFGRVVKIEAALGVHRGVTQGRNAGIRLGYSQIANPLYLAQKRAGYPFMRALEHIGRNLAMNLVRSARPEPHVDRRGRLRGNILALADLLRKRLAPERVLDL